MTKQESAIRAAVQALLDEIGDGWCVAQIVLCMGLERVNSNTGDIESTPWIWAPKAQAEWMTDGLIETALNMRALSDMIDDDD